MVQQGPQVQSPSRAPWVRPMKRRMGTVVAYGAALTGAVEGEGATVCDHEAKGTLGGRGGGEEATGG